MAQRSLVFLIIFTGGGIGSILRHAINQASAVAFGVNFPFGTLLVNLSGSFLMGVLAGWFALRGHDSHVRVFLTTGVLGGFTTFSAFSLDAAVMWERGQIGLTVIYAGTSVAGAILGVFCGLFFVRKLVL